MSFKIFSLQLKGKIKPVEKIEDKRKQLEQDFEEFNRVSNSQELKDFIELEKTITSEAFKKEKNEISSLQFKGSKEEKQLVEFEKLKKQKNIKNYFKVSQSADLKKFQQINNSEKLKEYNALESFVKNGEYVNEKKKLQRDIFKGSAEESKLTTFKKLEKSAGIKAYFELHESSALKKYNDFLSSEKRKKYLELKKLPSLDKEKKNEFKLLQADNELKTQLKFEKSKKFKLYQQTNGKAELQQYEKLKTETQSKNFEEKVSYLKDKKKFEKTEAHKKYLEFKRLENDSDIKFYFKYKKSGLYNNYLNVSGSSDLKRFEELEKLTSSKEFLERKAYLEDKNKWEKTEQHKAELKYAEFKKLPHLIKYFSYKNSTAFQFLQNWEVTFFDDFKGNKIDESKWLTTSFIAGKLLGDNYSMPGDLHVFTSDGSNLKVNNKLVIEIKRQKQMAKIWKMPAGFVTAELDYTSGTVSSGKSFWQENGIFEAKIKFAPVKNTVSSVFLSGEQNMPRLTLLESGEKNRVGISTLSANGKIELDGLDISNLKKGSWYIFTIEKAGGEITWKINDTEIYKANTSLFAKELQLTANSLVINEISGSQLPASFEIAWVKCYKKK